MSAFGKSVVDYWRGNRKATHIIERDDGYREEVAVEYLFRPPEEWPKEEIQVLDYIRPNSIILDIGCGVGRVAIYLQDKGHTVVGLDSCIEVLSIARKRGLKIPLVSNCCSLKNPPIFDQYDVILMLGNNFGLCGDLNNTRSMLKKLHSFLKEDGLIIFSSRDPSKTDKQIHFDYHERNRLKGLPIGLLTIRITYKHIKDDWWKLLLADEKMAFSLLKESGFIPIKSFYGSKDDSNYYAVAKKKSK